jgi:hypothetical protein
MQCISYDHEFSAEMERKFEAWNSPATKDKGPASGKGKRKRVGKRASTLPAADSGSDFAVESEDSDVGSDRSFVRRVRPRRAGRVHRADTPPHSASGLVSDEDMSDLTDMDYK